MNPADNRGTVNPARRSSATGATGVTSHASTLGIHGALLPCAPAFTRPNLTCKPITHQGLFIDANTRDVR